MNRSGKPVISVGNAAGTVSADNAATSDVQTRDDFRSGFVAIVGRPNVGKSTLVNHVVERKLSITADRPQTTRHQILGIKTTPSYQLVLVDTPGIHRGRPRALNRYMNRAATNAVVGTDCIVFMIEALKWTPADEFVMKRLEQSECPILLALNKVDRVNPRSKLLPFLSELSAKLDVAEHVPISAKGGRNVERLVDLIVQRLPYQAPLYPEDQFTDRSGRFLAAELVREKLTRRLGDEIPHQLTVEVEHWKEMPDIIQIEAIIWVERDGQKAIVIGHEGQGLKTAGSQARADLEKMLGRRVNLSLWVKVKDGWSDSERALRQLGFND